MAGKSILNQQILRNLGDRSYDKRKQAAVEIEAIVRQSHAQNPQCVPNIVQLLTIEYIQSTLPNSRKGGLIGLSSMALALSSLEKMSLDLLLPPVLRCLSDPEPRVRYYACEAMYNIIKVARSRVLVYFNEVFDALCKLFADTDVDVKSGAQLLDRLVKDIIIDNHTFNLERFIPLLRERIRIRNPFIRQLILSWVLFLQTKPELDFVEFLPEFVGGLFSMLSDPNKDVRQQAYSALGSLLTQLVQSKNIHVAAVASTLVEYSYSTDNFTKLTVLTWLTEFARISSTQLLHLLPSLIKAVLPNVADHEKEIKSKAIKCLDLFLRTVEETTVEFDVVSLITLLAHQLLSPEVSIRLSILRWATMLLSKYHYLVTDHLGDFFPSLLKTLQDSDDVVLKMTLEVIARIALNADNTLNKERLELVIVNILTLLASDVRYLEARGATILRQLSALLDAECTYEILSRLLSTTLDSDFCLVVIQTLNLILLTTPELAGLRQVLRSTNESEKGLQLFNTLYTTWIASPISAISLALLSQQYKLCWKLVSSLKSIEITVGVLIQLDKLVQLVESPVFVHVRIHLLSPHKYPHLLASLYGILALLPQSTAFQLLNTRLQSCSNFPSLLPNYVTEDDQPDETDELVQQYLTLQNAISLKRQKIYTKSIIATKTSDANN